MQYRYQLSLTELERDAMKLFVAYVLGNYNNILMNRENPCPYLGQSHGLRELLDALNTKEESVMIGDGEMLAIVEAFKQMESLFNEKYWEFIDRWIGAEPEMLEGLRLKIYKALDRN